MNFRNVILCALLFFSAFASSDVSEYIEPRVEGLRMDRCLTWGKGCDEPAAYKWCLKKGYSKAIYWEIEGNVGQNQPTKMLKSKAICNKPGCDAFKTIVCYKNT
jgi:hypothetical protein